MASTTFDLGTVIVSAIVSFGVSAIVGLVVTGIKLGREARVTRRLEARDRVHDIAGERLATVIKFRAGFQPHRVWEATRWIEDYMWASRILVASRRLGWLRRSLINRQLRWLVGDLAFSLAEVRPEPDPQTATGYAIWWQAKSIRRVNSDREAEKLFRLGALEAVLRGERDSKDVRLLKWTLWWLTRAW